MPSCPLVSAVIIFLNAEQFIEEAIASVFAQSYQDWELLLIDDGSSDRSTDIARQNASMHPTRVRYFEHDYHRNYGMSASRNLGISHAKGEYVAFLDADDRWSANQLSEQVNILTHLSSAAAVYGKTRYWFSWSGCFNEMRQDFLTDIDAPKHVLINPPFLWYYLFSHLGGDYFAMCSFMIRKEILEVIGGFDNSFRDLFEDIVIHAKIFLEFPVVLCDACWGWYRQHDRSICAVRRQTEPEVAAREMLIDWLERYLLEKRVNDASLLQLAKAPWQSASDSESVLTAAHALARTCKLASD